MSQDRDRSATSDENEKKKQRLRARLEEQLRAIFGANTNVPVCVVEPSRSLCIHNGGIQSNVDPRKLWSILSSAEIASPKAVCLNCSLPFCFVLMHSADSACRMKELLEGSVFEDATTAADVTPRRFLVDFVSDELMVEKAEKEDRQQHLEARGGEKGGGECDEMTLRREWGTFFPRCQRPARIERLPGLTPTTPFEVRSFAIPGLFVIPDFVGAAEETALVDGFLSSSETDGKWEWLAKRRVLHLNRKFIYGENVAAPPLAFETLPIPCVVESAIIKRFRSLVLGADDNTNSPFREYICDPANFHSPSSTTTVKDVLAFDQVTVNDYKAGTGIAPHVDAHGFFHHVILSLSLGSGAMMEFFAPGEDERETPSTTTTTTAGTTPTAATVFLERRSLLIMSGTSRFHYTHGIRSRLFDVAAPTLVPVKRERRFSVTLRSCKQSERKTCTSCSAPWLCDAQPGTRQEQQGEVK